MKKEKFVEMLGSRQCPDCEEYELISYFPNIDRINGVRPFRISQEIECENCGFYIEYVYDIENIKVNEK